MLSTADSGRVIVLTATLLFAYISVWLLILPFVEEGHPVLRFFPPVEVALLLASGAGVSVGALALGVAGWFCLVDS